MSEFDYFSKQAVSYSRSRPNYPEGLIQFVSQLSQNRHRVLDCAAGSGQAALDLVPYFDQVFATDISMGQLRQAPKDNPVNWVCASAEHLPFADQSFDLITVAQAWHWFAGPDFEAEIHRVLVPGGHLVIWGYNLLHVNDAVDVMVHRFYHDLVGPYWPEERQILVDNYADFPYMLTPVPCPTFSMSAIWPYERVKEYILSWSATQRYIEAESDIMVERLLGEMKGFWRQPQEITWPVVVKAGRKDKPTLARNAIDLPPLRCIG